MTKKDFEAIARVIKVQSEIALSRLEFRYTRFALGEVAEGIADICQQSNPRFNRSRFLRACGLPEGES